MGEFSRSRIFFREQPNLHQVRTFSPSAPPQTDLVKLEGTAIITRSFMAAALIQFLFSP